MTAATSTVRAAVLRRAALRAMLAPSVHNTQPWRFVVTDRGLDVQADRTRQLTVLDPRARQLRISCGCALFHARVAVAAAGYEPMVSRLPDPRDSDLLARVDLGGQLHDQPIAALDPEIERRRTNRRAYADEPVPPELVRTLVTAARVQGAHLFQVSNPRHRIVVAELCELAERIEAADPRYLAELRAWTTDDPRRPDGVQAVAVPYAGAGAERPDVLPVRAFDTAGMGWLPASSHSDTHQCLLLLCASDDPLGWVRAGEALEHVWLEVTRAGYWASPFTQLIEVRATRDSLQHRLGLTAAPQLLLRVGRAPDVAPSRRREPADVIVDEMRPAPEIDRQSRGVVEHGRAGR
ncbi:MAG TPA: hypothetical protein VFU35_12145 [Jatrophihabitans sp.]|nr:hypothetical protein [Jatrophihabitans sp.]